MERGARAAENVPIVSPDPPELLQALVGPTATGKTAVAIGLAERLGAEIVSVDSMQVYRGMDVGTAKPDRATLLHAPHHVIDCAEPNERYDARCYLEDVRTALADLSARGVPALFVGGTGFYLKALTHGLFEGPPADLDLRRAFVARAREVGSDGLHAELVRVDPESARRIHPNDERRVVRAHEVLEQTGRRLSEWQREWRDAAALESAGRPRHLLGLELDVAALDERIERRARDMLGAGWVEEAVLIAEGVGFGPTAIQALGYREVLAHAAGELTRPELEETIRLRTRQFARRQRTWFRKFQDITWIAAPGEAAGELERAVDEAARLLRRS